MRRRLLTLLFACMVMIAIVDGGAQRSALAQHGTHQTGWAKIHAAADQASLNPLRVAESPFVGNQGPPAAPVEATLLTERFRWTTEPFAELRAELRGSFRNDLDALRGVYYGTADGYGRITGTISASSNLPNQGTNEPVFRPGDRLVLKPSGGEAVTVTIPTLSADIEEVNDWVYGYAPPGATLKLTLWRVGVPGEPLTTETKPDADGHYVQGFSAEDLGPGDRGEVRMETPEGNTFIALFAGFNVEIVVGASAIAGQASPGSRIVADIATPSGVVTTTRPATVLRSDRWSVSSIRNTIITPGTLVDVHLGRAIENPVFHTSQTDTIHVEVPGLTVNADRTTGEISGFAPSGFPVELTAQMPTGETETKRATVQPDGSYRTTMSDPFVMGPAARVTAKLALTPGIVIKAQAAVMGFRISVFGTAILGMVTPRSTVTVTVRSADGQVKVVSGGRVPDSGLMTWQLIDFAHPDSSGRPANIQILPGDIVEAEQTTGDPWRFVVPELLAHVKVTTDEVSGRAPGGAEVRVLLAAPSDPFAGVSGGGYPNPPLARKITKADANGDFTAGLGDQRHVQFGQAGSAIWRPSPGVEFFTSWAAIQIQFLHGRPYFGGLGPSGQAVSVTVLARDGHKIGGGTANTGGFGGTDLERFLVNLNNGAGGYLIPEAGDTLVVEVGREAVSLSIPAIRAVSHVASNIIIGHTLPDMVFSLQVRHVFGYSASSGRERLLQTDSVGNFEHAFKKEDFQLEYNDRIQLTLNLDGHIILHEGAATGLTLSLNDAAVTGSMTPYARAAVDLLQSGHPPLRIPVIASALAVFTAKFRDASGKPVSPLPGDTIEVRPENQTDGDVYSMVVPTFTLKIDPDRRTVSGESTPGGRIQVSAVDNFLVRDSNGRSFSDPVVGADGHFSAQYSDAKGIGAGQHVQAAYRLPNGHRVITTRTLPFISAAHGSNEVCGYADNGQAVNVELIEADGRVIGRGQSIAGSLPTADFRLLIGRIEADPRLEFDTRLKDENGKAVSIDSGAMLRATVGGTVITSTVPTINITTNWATALITGTYADAEGLTGVSAMGTYPSASCFVFGPPFDVGPWSSSGMAIRPNGAFWLTGAPSRPGNGIEIGFTKPNGTRFYRQIYRTKGEVFVHTSRVGGLTMPGTNVAITVTAADGTPRANGKAQADGDGRFDLNFSDANGKRLEIRPGDKVILDGGSEAPTIGAEALTFDASPESGIVGAATPGRTVDFVLTPRNGRAIRFSRQAGESGRFRFGLDEVPPRSGWTFADLSQIRLAIVNAEGHETVMETKFEPPNRPMIHLPWIGLNSRWIGR